MATNTGNFIESTQLANSGIKQGVDQLGDGIKDGFDKMMTWLINDGALARGMGNIAEGASNLADRSIPNRPADPSVTPNAATKDTAEKPTPQISRAQQITVCPGGTEVAAQISNATLNLTHVQSNSAMEVSTGALTGQGQGYCVAQSSMVAPTAAQHHQQAEQLSI